MREGREAEWKADRPRDEEELNCEATYQAGKDGREVSGSGPDPSLAKGRTKLDVVKAQYLCQAVEDL